MTQKPFSDKAERTAPTPEGDVSLPDGRRRRSSKDVRRARMREAALSFFSHYGLHGTSLDQIADLAGVSKTNLLYHYPSKEALYLAVLHEMLDIWKAPFAALHHELEPLDAIRHYIRLKLEMSRDHAEASKLFCLEIMQGAPLLKGELEGSVRELVEEKSCVIRRWTEEGRLAPVDPGHLFYMLWASTQHYSDFAAQIEAVSGRSLKDPDFLEEAIDNVQSMIIAGITPR